ncbi:MAG: nuclear transport factor 2 family protein [Saprospiraceae bacterium]|nr:nuclear transport factor 2 family protein [Saprospiraceae bacterium]
MLKVLFFSLFFTLTDIHAQSDLVLKTQEISKVLMAQQTDWNNGDIDAFMQGYWKSDSLTFIGSKGLTYGWQKTLENYKKSYPDSNAMGKLTFEIIRLDVLSDTAAIMIGRYTLVRVTDQPTGLFTLIWKKINGRWLIISDQTCG